MESSAAAGAAAPLVGDGRVADAAAVSGMSKEQLYQLMSEVKALMDDNPEQARKILIENPELTRALFKGQVMLGMVRPSKKVPELQQTQAQSSQVELQKVQSTPLASTRSQTSAPQPMNEANASHPNIPFPPVQPQPVLANSSHFLQMKQQPTTHLNQMAVSQSAQVSGINLPLPPPPAAQQFSNLAQSVPAASGPIQQPSQNPLLFNQQLQPPLSQVSRAAPMQHFTHQMQQQIPSFRLDHGGGPQQVYSQSQLYHAGANFQPSFPASQALLSSQRPLQQPYQGASHIGLQPERAGQQQYMAGRSDLSSLGASQSFAQIPFGQMNQGLNAAQHARPPPLAPDVEKALLQQVMSLTPEQISLLPPEQRQQVLQLREMLIS